MGLHDGHRARKKEQFRRHGLDGFADHEVLELLLYYAIPRRDTNETAHRLLQKFGSLQNVFSAEAEELARVEGVGESAALFLTLLPAVQKRAARSGGREKVLNSVDKKGSTWTNTAQGPMSALNATVQRLAGAFSSEVLGVAGAAAASRGGRSDIIRNETGQTESYLNPQFRYQGNSADGSRIRSQRLKDEMVERDQMTGIMVLLALLVGKPLEKRMQIQSLSRHLWMR